MGSAKPGDTHPPDAEVLSVLDGTGQRSHHLLLLQPQDAQVSTRPASPYAAPLRRRTCLTPAVAASASGSYPASLPDGGDEGVASSWPRDSWTWGGACPSVPRLNHGRVPGGQRSPQAGFRDCPSAHKEHQGGRRGPTITPSMPSRMHATSVSHKSISHEAASGPEGENQGLGRWGEGSGW